MKDLNTLFSKVKASSTASEEEKRIEDVWQYMYENRVYVAVYTRNETGRGTDINNLPNPADVETVEVVFTKDNMENSFQWDPIDNENIFVLFREK